MIGKVGENTYAGDLSTETHLMIGADKHVDFNRVFSDLPTQGSLKQIATESTPFKGLSFETVKGEKFKGSLLLNSSADTSAL
jgi:hypothetical protein